MISPATGTQQPLTQHTSAPLTAMSSIKATECEFLKLILLELIFIEELAR